MINGDEPKRKSALEELRLKAHKTRVQVGREVGVTERNVYDWETGKFFPRFDRAVALAHSLGVTLDELCESLGLQAPRKQNTGTAGSNPGANKPPEGGDVN